MSQNIVIIYANELVEKNADLGLRYLQWDNKSI